MQDMIQFYIGYALSEITDDPDIEPAFEKTIPEMPSVRVPPENEQDLTGETPVPLPETTRELKEHHDIEGVPYDNYWLEVVVPEIMPFYHGKGSLIDETTREPLRRRYDYELKSQDNPSIKGSVEESPSIKCYYWGGSNHSVPHITMGEQVLVIHHKGNDKYYWKELGRDNELRRIEKYRIFVNDQRLVVKTADVIGNNEKRVNDDNSYYLEFDTINKHILLSTANSDGETIRYFMKFNCKTNTYSLWDTRGNRFELDSDEHRWYFRNADQSVVDMHRTHINIWAQDSINLEADHVNCISRMDRSDITGMEPSYKEKQLEARLHQQSYPAPIMLGDELGPGDNNSRTKVAVGVPGFHSHIVSTKEEVHIPTKDDDISEWTVLNNQLTFNGNIITVVATQTSFTSEAIVYTINKSSSYTYNGLVTLNGPGGANVTISITNWNGTFNQQPLMAVNKIVSKSPIV